MTATTPTDDPTTRKSLRGPLIMAVLAFGIAAAGGFAVSYLGVMQSLLTARTAPADQVALPVFVPVEQMTVSLPSDSGARFVRLTAQIETTEQARANVQALLPRLLSVINTYLHAVDAASLQQPAAVVRLRAQLLRRLQMVAGDDAILDFLILEFIVG
jgi:flagellar FliL protein